MVCAKPECHRAAHARGLCGAHYMAAKRSGELPETRRNTQSMPLGQRLQFYGWTVTDSGCWEWNGNRFSNGYGQLYVAGRKHLTHRLAYETWVGPIPEGLLIRHKCDNKPCINPDHLETGTDADNKRDMIERGLDGVVGEKNKNAVLTEDDVRNIRSLVAKGGRGAGAKAARQYGVSQATISWVVSGKRWGHVR